VATLCRLAEPTYREAAPELVEVAPVPLGPLTAHVLDAPADLLAFAQGSSIRVLRGIEGAPVEAAKIPLPWLQSVHALAHRDGVVFVGGDSGAGSALLAIIDLRGPARFQPVDVPERVRALGKRVDGFAFHGDRLIVVDDVVVPKYLLVYDVADARAPRLVDERVMPAGPLSQVFAVASSDHGLAVLSTSGGRGGAFTHADVYGLDTLIVEARLSARRGTLIGPPPEGFLDLRSVALAERTLILAAGADGIGVVALGGRSGPIIPAADVRLVPVRQGKVVHVVAIDDARAIAVVETRRGWLGRRRLDSVVVPLG
jgi:hypothetical protein